jgi:hypothetical protein
VAGLPWLARSDALRRVDASEDVRTLASLVEQRGANRVLADYWVAHRVTFETNERIIATPATTVRSPRYDDVVRAAIARGEPVVRIAFADSPLEARWQRELIATRATDKAGRWETVRQGQFVLFVPRQPLSPERASESRSPRR